MTELANRTAMTCDPIALAVARTTSAKTNISLVLFSGVTSTSILAIDAKTMVAAGTMNHPDNYMPKKVDCMQPVRSTLANLDLHAKMLYRSKNAFNIAAGRDDCM
jgi:hypothetical protein